MFNFKVTSTHSTSELYLRLCVISKWPLCTQWTVPSMRTFFWERMVSSFLRFSTSVSCFSLSCDRWTSSLWSRSHICCISASADCSASRDFCSELMVFSSGPISSPYTKIKGLLFDDLAKSMVISEWVLTCDSAHLWWLYRAAPLGGQAISSVTWNPTQSHYAYTEPTSPFPILIRKGQVSI